MRYENYSIILVKKKGINKYQRIQTYVFHKNFLFLFKIKDFKNKI